MSNYEFSLVCAVIAWAFSNVLINDGAIFSRYGDWLARLVDNNKSWIAKPIGYCSQCFAGQISLWAGFVLLAQVYVVTPLLALCQHLFIICLSVVLTRALDVLKRI